ncbi:MAG TPA: GNAT family N-acetyltransferase [Phycisphaerae bacterium]|nr:GNAT family N-acetyltransferase [Phycisphaerae bacterium]
MTEPDIILTEPDESMRDAYLDYINDYAAVGEEGRYDGDDRARGDFAAFVQRMRDQAQGIGLPAGWVPASTYWLMDGERIVGECNLRHRLTEALLDFGGHVGYAIRPSERNKGYATRMLRLLLAKARQLGIRRVRITCAAENAASARVIAKCGGVLDSESYSPQAERVTQRYWINVD